jgi:ArsR family metal-binding transcriptional regulator
MNNVVLSVVEINGVYSLGLGNNIDNKAFQDLKMNWNKLDSFKVKENQSTDSLSGFCRNYLQPALTLLNDGNIARSSNKSEEQVMKDAEDLEKSINYAISGRDAGKGKTSKKRIGIKQYIEKFTSVKLEGCTELEKAEHIVDFLKNERRIKKVEKQLKDYSVNKYMDSNFYTEQLNTVEVLKDTLNSSK